MPPPANLFLSRNTAGACIGVNPRFRILSGARMPVPCLPGGEPGYLAMFEKFLDLTIEAGFILPDDRCEILALAELGFHSALD
jgi:hypothetical protein